MSLLETLEEILGENGIRRDKRLKNWNDTVESLISASPEEQVQAGKLWQEKKNHHSKDPFEYVASVSQRLAELLVLSLFDDAEQDVVGASVDEQANQLLQVWKQQDETGFFFLSREETTRFAEILRTSKNFLRWYIQMFSAAHTGSRPHEVVGVFSLTSMLELSLELLDRIVEEDVARHAASLFLYATYNPVSGSDDTLQRAFQYLEDKLFTRILRRMLVTKTPPLALSLVRIIHNAVASYPNSTAHVNETAVDISTIDDASRLAPWAPQEGTIATFKQVFRDMIVWSIQDGDFPGGADDFRGELVLEVLRTFYAIRMGLICTIPVADERFAKALVDLLKLDIHQDDERAYECLLATIALLMDSDPSFVDYILEHHCENAILSIFEKQVGRIFESKRIDDSAAASLVPSLVVLHNYSKDSPTFRSTVKSKLFPPDAETDFRKKIEEEKHDENPKNMKPLDAPEGTLRYKVITLLSLPQGHIKRFTGELLWILCGCDTTEFIRRVGIGYGVNILNLKGALQLPASVQQG